MGGGGGGAGGGLITDGNARLLVEDDVAGMGLEGTTDPQPRPVIDWGTDVGSPSISEGDSLSGSWGSQHRLKWGQDIFTASGTLGSAVYVGPGATWGPLWQTHALSFHTKSVYSVDGDGNKSWPTTPAAWACGLGLGSCGGWRESEWWTSRTAVLGTPPANAAGLLVTIGLDTPLGPMGATGGTVRVRGSAPTVGRSGVAVANIPMGTTQVLIPMSALSGVSTLWVGVGPAWQADYRLTSATHGFTGQEGACVGGYTSRSGYLRVASISTPKWAVYSSTEPDFGTTVVLDPDETAETPWEGGNDILDAGTEGSPTSTGVADGAFYVEGPGGRCVRVLGEVADEEQPWSVWSDAHGWSVSFPFEADALATDGEIELTTTRPGMRTIATIDLDSSPSVTVATPLASDTAAVAITAGARWMARFDDRSGYLRGKVWLLTDGEPTDWLVEVELPEETEDTGDQIVLCIRAGTSQTVRVFPLESMAAAPSTWIRERVGRVSGESDRFLLSHGHVLGTLWFDVGGSFVPAFREESGIGWLDYIPTAGMVVWANYLST